MRVVGRGGFGFYGGVWVEGSVRLGRVSGRGSCIGLILGIRCIFSFCVGSRCFL